jgi:hypothetical protein
MYDVSITVKDETHRPVNNAHVQLKLHSIRNEGYRLITARATGHGEYRTWTRLNPPWDNPRRLMAWVTPASRDAQ